MEPRNFRTSEPQRTETRRPAGSLLDLVGQAFQGFMEQHAGIPARGKKDFKHSINRHIIDDYHL